MVAVVNLVPFSTAARSVRENQIAIGSFEKLRVSNSMFLCAHRACLLFQASGIIRFFRLKIDQRINMHVAGNMQISFLIQHHGDVVMGVPTHAGRQTRFGPGFFRKQALGNGHIPGTVVISHKLVRRFGQQGIFGGTARPDLINQKHLCFICRFRFCAAASHRIPQDESRQAYSK